VSDGESSKRLAALPDVLDDLPPAGRPAIIDKLISDRGTTCGKTAILRDLLDHGIDVVSALKLIFAHEARAPNNRECPAGLVGDTCRLRHQIR